MILVTGAGGKTGKAVIAALASKGAAVRAFVRQEGQISALRTLGAAEVVAGDMEDVNTFERATGGIEKIYHICPNVHPREAAIGRSAIDAAVHAGIGHFVYHSVLHPQIEAMPHHWHKMRVEEMLLASDLAWTFLRPTAYMQNIGGQWDRVKSEGIFEVPYSLDTKISLVDLQDIAEVAARILTEDGHDFAAYDLSSAAAPDQHKIAGALGAALGRPVEARQVAVEAWNSKALEAGLGEYERGALIKMFHYYEKNGLRGNPSMLKRLLAREPGTLADYLATLG